MNELIEKLRGMIVPGHPTVTVFADDLRGVLDEVESLQEKLCDAKHGIELADSEIVGWRQENELLKAEAARTTAQLEKLDDAGHTAITDWPMGSPQPQFGDGLDRLLELPGELERLKKETADGNSEQG